MNFCMVSALNTMTCQTVTFFIIYRNRTTAQSAAVLFRYFFNLFINSHYTLKVLSGGMSVYYGSDFCIIAILFILIYISHFFYLFSVTIDEIREFSVFMLTFILAL